MDLFDVKGAGLWSPLNAREISQLVRHGQLHHKVPCKPTGEAAWSTVDQLFPLLKHSPEVYSLPSYGSERRRRWFWLVVGTILSASALYVLLTRGG